MSLRSFVLLFLSFFSSCTPPRQHKPVGPHPVEFTYWNPAANKVFLAGDFNGWNTTSTPMHQAPNKEWKAEVIIKPGRHQYKFIADGHWTQDPANVDTAPDLFGGNNSVIIVNPSADQDGQAERRRISMEAHRMIEEDDFAAIEKRTDELRRKKTRLRQGRWELQPFYDGLNLSDYSVNESEWSEALSKLDAWHRQFPNSITEPVARAHTLIGFAWKARGTGWAREVSRNGWGSMKERLKQARESLEDAAKLPQRCPEWYSAMQAVALGQQWTRDEYENLFEEAVANEPNYYDYFFNKAYFLTPRWYGHKGEWENFADDAAIHYDPGEGLALYTRIAWSKEFLFGNLFRESAIRWPRMRDGFVDIMNQWPNSVWNLNNFCWFACKADDHKTAKRLFNDIGDEFDYNVWHSRSQYAAAKRWALTDNDSPSVHPEFRSAPRRSTRASAIASRPGGKDFYVGYSDGVLLRSDAGPNHAVAEVAHFERNILHIAASANGYLVAVALGTQGKQSGEVRIIDPANGEVKGSIGDWDEAPYDLAFSRDGKTLAAVGGRGHKPGIARIWDATDAISKPVPWPAPKHLLVTAALSSDAHLLMTNDDRNIRVWNLPENRSVFTIEKGTPELVLGVAFSPDGKWAAAVCSADSYESDVPGVLIIWNVADWTEAKRVQLDCGAEHVVFSPDSRFVAATRRDNTVTIWRTKDWSQAIEFLPMGGYISGIAFNGDTLAASTFEGGFTVWRLPNFVSQP